LIIFHQQVSERPKDEIGAQDLDEVQEPTVLMQVPAHGKVESGSPSAVVRDEKGHRPFSRIARKTRGTRESS
jgi:hypothetical protein